MCPLKRVNFKLMEKQFWFELFYLLVNLNKLHAIFFVQVKAVTSQNKFSVLFWTALPLYLYSLGDACVQRAAAAAAKAQ